MPESRQIELDPVVGRGWYDGQAQVMHRHSQGQLIYPAAGVLAVTTGRGTWMAAANGVAWTPAGFDHSHRAPARTDIVALMIPSELCTSLPDHPAVLGVSGLLREAMLALVAGRPLRPQARDRLLGVVVDELTDAAQQSLYLPEPRDGRLRAVTELLRSDLTDARTLTELGRQVGASARTLSGLFHAELGTSFHQWRTQLRVQHAMVFLWQGHSVTQTATLCGWSNPSSFVDAFFAIVGQTPGRYQATQQQPASQPVTVRT
jgi:AraC-like DNA-binding protein